MELIGFNAANEILFHENTDLNRVFLYKNILQDVNRIAGDLSFEAGNSYLKLDNSGIEIKSANGLEVYSNKGNLLFPPDLSRISIPEMDSISIPGGAKGVHMIRSPINQDLGIYSKEKLHITGNEGVHLSSKSVHLNAASINLTSTDSAIILDAAKGISLNMADMPIVNSAAKTYEYKLCICGKTGRIFRIKINDEYHGCADVKFPESINPCT